MTLWLVALWAGWRMRQRQAALEAVRQEVEQLTQLYVRVSYAQYQPDRATQQEVVQNWLQLRRRLWLARLIRFF